MKNTRLVFSTDPRDQVACPRCKKYKEECRCIVQEDPVSAFTAVFRLEKNGRGGKTVTVLDGFPKNEKYLSDLTKELKSKCGTGGTFSLDGKTGTIEIQGDSREKIKKILDTKKIKYKGV